MKSDDLKRVELRLQTADGLLRRNISTTREVRDMAESQLLKNIGDVIAGVLLDLPDQLFESVEDTLKTLGAASTDDLKNITENDLLPVLKPIQAQRLAAAWTQNSSSCFIAETFMLSIDKKIVNDHITTFTSAICLLFGSYYCFNIHYPVELRSTLEFLQC
ncbi:hypothetical protein HF521_016862 [Silurus meridionalis]|uniref:Uncharacterized protein n=1 Tax=Silurus meridionalis TaxID=175797 RepID=A0A8T0BLJ5_SILME|nr:hypothetical protein HF521_016862 [Silurus meridionalis]